MQSQQSPDPCKLHIDVNLDQVWGRGVGSRELNFAHSQRRGVVPVGARILTEGERGQKLGLPYGWRKSSNQSFGTNQDCLRNASHRPGRLSRYRWQICRAERISSTSTALARKAQFVTIANIIIGMKLTFTHSKTHSQTHLQPAGKNNYNGRTGFSGQVVILRRLNHANPRALASTNVHHGGWPVRKRNTQPTY